MGQVTVIRSYLKVVHPADADIDQIPLGIAGKITIQRWLAGLHLYNIGTVLMGTISRTQNPNLHLLHGEQRRGEGDGAELGVEGEVLDAQAAGTV